VVREDGKDVGLWAGYALQHGHEAGERRASRCGRDHTTVPAAHLVGFCVASITTISVRTGLPPAITGRETGQEPKVKCSCGGLEPSLLLYHTVSLEPSFRTKL